MNSLTFNPAITYTPPSESTWAAHHAGYSELTGGGSYVEAQHEWTGAHASYDDVFVPCEPETGPGLPNLKAMLAVVRPARRGSLVEGVLSGAVSSTGRPTGFVPGEAMAGGMGISRRVSLRAEEQPDHESVKPIDGASETALKSHGGNHHPFWPMAAADA